jgi:benzoyl-CoA-dihydrodiol lyase
LPEVPLLAVLPGTGGLTRVVDKRFVRRDLADVFSTRSEGVRGQQALDWGLVDAVAPKSTFDQVVHGRAMARAASSDRPDRPGITLPTFGESVIVDGDSITSIYVDVTLDRELGTARFVVRGPQGEQPATAGELLTAGADAWLLRCVLELDYIILHLRFNEPEIGTWVLTTLGDGPTVEMAEAVLLGHSDWLVREVRLQWTRTLKRLDASSRTLVTLVEPGSCFVGVLAELVLAADRSFMLDGQREGDDRPAAMLRLTEANNGQHPMSNGLSRLRTRFWGRDDAYKTAAAHAGEDLEAVEAVEAELVTFALDDIDWDDEVRVMLEERNSFSPDALTGMEANFRFVGPETMETKIFARLTAWQNWIFQRPNAVGPEGALQRFGTGSRPTFDRKRV